MATFNVFPQEAQAAGCTATGGFLQEQTFSSGTSLAKVKFLNISASPADGWRFVCWEFSSLYSWEFLGPESYRGSGSGEEFTVNTDNPMVGSVEYYGGRNPALWNPPNPFQFDYDRTESNDSGVTTYHDSVYVTSVTAVFEKGQDQVTITAIADPNEAGTVAGGGVYAKGSSVTVTATARQGYKFSRWETPDGTIVSTQASYSFTASENRTLVAKFVENKPYIVYYHIPEGFPKSLVNVLAFKTSDNWHTKIIEQVGVKDAVEPNVKYAEFYKLDHNTKYDFVCRIDAASWDESIDRYSVCAAVTSSKVNCSGIQVIGYDSLVRAIHTRGALVEQDGSLDVYLCVTPYVYLSKRLSELIESDKIGYESLAYDSVNVNYGRVETTRFEILPRSFSPYPTSGAHGAYGSEIGDNECITCGWAKFNISSEAINYFKKSKIAIAFYFPKDCILNRESISKSIAKQYAADELTFAFIQKYRDFDTSEIPVEVDADIRDGNPWIVIDIAESGLLYGPDHNLLIYDPQTSSLVFYDATK